MGNPESIPIHAHNGRCRMTRFRAVWLSGSRGYYEVCPDTFPTEQEAVAHGWTHRDEILETIGNGSMRGMPVGDDDRLLDAKGGAE
jgi:hypothetical protein